MKENYLFLNFFMRVSPNASSFFSSFHHFTLKEWKSLYLIGIKNIYYTPLCWINFYILNPDIDKKQV